MSESLRYELGLISLYGSVNIDLIVNIHLQPSSYLLVVLKLPKCSFFLESACPPKQHLFTLDFQVPHVHFFGVFTPERLVAKALQVELRR